MKTIPLILFLVLSLSLHAQKPQDWKVKTSKNTTERAEILDIARNKVFDELKQQAQFKVRHLKVSKDFAWFEADALSSSGNGLVFPDDFYDCCHVEGLFKKENGKWKAIEFGAFSTDCWYCGISLNYPEIPESIFSEAAIGRKE